MARLRLFAAAAEAAGRSNEQVENGTVADVLAAAVARYGKTFAAVVPTCQVWLNGEPVGDDALVSESDELAVLPPVSGG